MTQNTRNAIAFHVFGNFAEKCKSQRARTASRSQSALVYGIIRRFVTTREQISARWLTILPNLLGQVKAFWCGWTSDGGVIGGMTQVLRAPDGLTGALHRLCLPANNGAVAVHKEVMRMVDGVEACGLWCGGRKLVH